MGGDSAGSLLEENNCAYTILLWIMKHPFSPFRSPIFAHPFFPAHPVENTVLHSFLRFSMFRRPSLCPYHTSDRSVPPFFVRSRCSSCLKHALAVCAYKPHIRSRTPFHTLFYAFQCSRRPSLCSYHTSGRSVSPFFVHSRRSSCLKHAYAVCAYKPHIRSRTPFHTLFYAFQCSRRPSPPAVPHVRYKRSVLPCLCSPGVRLARPTKCTDTRFAHFPLYFLYFLFCFCVRSGFLLTRQPLST